MNLIKKLFGRIWFDGNNSSTKSDRCSDDIDSQDRETEALSEYVVPQRTISVKELHSIDECHNSFNVIVQDCINSNLKYRIKSDNSHEVFRMHCVNRCYKTEFIDANLSDVLWKKIHLVTSSSSFCSSEDDYHFWVRVFRTDGGKYFQQTIHPNGSATYKIVDAERVQTLLEKCETEYEDEKKIWIDKSDYASVCVLRNGMVLNSETKQSDIHVDWVVEHESIIDYDVVDDKLYEGIVEVY